MKIDIKISYYVVMIILLNVFALYSTTPDELLLQGNDAFSKNNVAAAEEIYNKLLLDGFDTFSIHFNLSLAYFKLDRPGLAVYHAEKALLKRPYHKLPHILLEKIEEKYSIDTGHEYRFLDIIIFFIPPFLLTILFSILIVVLCVLAFMYIRSRHRRILHGLIVVITFTILISLMTFIQYFYNQNNSCIITASDSVPLLLSNKLDTVVGELHEGMRCKVLKVTDLFTEVEYNQQITGFLKNEYIKILKY